MTDQEDKFYREVMRRQLIESKLEVYERIIRDINNDAQIYRDMLAKMDDDSKEDK